MMMMKMTMTTMMMTVVAVVLVAEMDETDCVVDEIDGVIVVGVVVEVVAASMRMSNKLTRHLCQSLET